jgi:hypothetical protein
MVVAVNSEARGRPCNRIQLDLTLPSSRRAMEVKGAAS